MNHRVGRTLFALVVSAVVAVLAYQWITNPDGRSRRIAEESAVLAAREILVDTIAVDRLEIVDPLSPNRKVGKVYVYAEAPGWAVSGYYRRNDRDRWHPFLMTLSPDSSLKRLKVQDPGLLPQAAVNPLLEIAP